MLATAVFDLRLPAWLMTPAEAPKQPLVELVPNWWRLGLLVAIVGVVAITVIVLLSRGPSEPKVTDYKKDFLFNMIWRWNYAGQNLRGFACFCPHCDLQLRPTMIQDWPTQIYNF